MGKIAESDLKQLFIEARTFTSWQPKTVEDSILHEIYEMMKWGPTSANSCPVRILFVKSQEGKEKLIPCLSPGNVEKVKAAPVTAIIAMDEEFYNQLPKLAPHNPAFKETFASNAKLAKETAFRNSSLQGAYFIIATRAMGLDCGPMSGFNNQKLDEAFFSGTSLKSNFLCNIGYGNRDQLHPRAPRLSFDEACKIV